MARFIKPKLKNLQRFGILPGGVSIRRKKGKFRKKTDYGMRLEEKQKLKFVYQIGEKQLRRYVNESVKRKDEAPATVILQLLETRLDNIIYQLGFAETLLQARQLVSHGHVLINNKRVDIPSYNVSPGEEITLKDKICGNDQVQKALAEKKSEQVPVWLKREDKKGIIIRIPEKNELRQDVNMSYIVEFYT